MSTEVTPAVQRAAESLSVFDNGPLWGDAREALAVALDVEEIESIMRRGVEAWGVHDIQPGETMIGFLAQYLRTAILGSD